MEAEFGIKLNCDLNPNLISSDYIIDSIESIYPLIEIHNLIFYGDAPHGAELLANNAIHAGVILGPENKFGYDRSWQIISMSGSKHLGYAFQWFSMAIALVVMTIIFFKRKKNAQKN